MNDLCVFDTVQTELSELTLSPKELAQLRKLKLHD